MSDEDDHWLQIKHRKLSDEAKASVSMTPLSDAVKDQINKLRPQHSSPTPTMPSLPPMPLWEKRQFFIVAGPDNRKTAVWVDDDCIGMHVRYELENGTGTYLGHLIWHSYSDPSGRRWALRCPQSLTPEEHAQLQTDTPTGHWRSALREYSNQNPRHPSADNGFD